VLLICIWERLRRSPLPAALIEPAALYATDLHLEAPVALSATELHLKAPAALSATDCTPSVCSALRYRSVLGSACGALRYRAVLFVQQLGPLKKQSNCCVPRRVGHPLMSKMKKFLRICVPHTRKPPEYKKSANLALFEQSIFGPPGGGRGGLLDPLDEFSQSRDLIFGLS
jgi:hypothetical protein